MSEGGRTCSFPGSRRARRNVSPLCKHAFMTVYEVSATEARDGFGHCIMSATYDDYRYVVWRHGVKIRAIVGIADLGKLENLDGNVAEPPGPPAPALAPGSYEWMKGLYENGEPVPEPQTPEQRAAFWKLAAEIGERLQRN